MVESISIMAEYELVQERVISGQGILRVPVDKVKNRYSVLFVDVIRYPRNAYLNRNWNPPRGKYAFLTFVRDTYVIDAKAMEFPSEAYDGIADIAGQTLLAVKCAYEGTLESFKNLTLGLAGTPGGVGLVYLGYTDLIKDYENLDLSWNEVRIKCYADTAIQARLYRLEYDVCNPDKDDQRRPPSPPPPLEPVPPGTPLDLISDPYDPESSDGGDTEPYPGDSFVEPPLEPPGENCEKYVVVVRVFTNFSPDPDFRDFTMYVYGEVAGVRKNSFQGQTAAVIDCKGLFLPTDETCKPNTVARTVYNGINSFDPDPEIISFELYQP